MHKNNYDRPKPSTLTSGEQSVIMASVIQFDGKTSTVWRFIENCLQLSWRDIHYAEDTVAELLHKAVKQEYCKAELKKMVLGILLYSGPYISYEAEAMEILQKYFSCAEIKELYEGSGRYDTWVGEVLVECSDKESHMELQNYVKDHEFNFFGDSCTLASLTEEFSREVSRCCGGHDTIYQSRFDEKVVVLAEKLKVCDCIIESKKLLEFFDLENVSISDAYSSKQKAYGDVMNDYVL